MLEENNVLSVENNIPFKYKNLNECVDSLLKKSKEENWYDVGIRKRQRKNKEQLKVLVSEYKKNQNWDRDHILRIAGMLNMKEG